MKALVTIAVAIAAAPAWASAAPTETTAANAGAADQAQPRLVCRRVEALSGSHVSRSRVCRTAAQWRAMHDGNVDDAVDAMGPMTRAQDLPANGVNTPEHRPQ